MLGKRKASREIVGQIGDGLGGYTKRRRAFDPSHGEDQGESNQLLFVGESREDDAEIRYSRGSKRDAIKTVGQVSFGDVDRAEVGASMMDRVENAFQRSPELHGLGWHHPQGILVDAIESVVNDEAGTTLPLGNHPEWGQT
jgi:hypothetical protein